MSFAALIDGASQREAGFALTVPETWHQGRTGYGGFSAALALAAAKQVGGDGLPPLRSAAIGFVGPVFGEVEASARVLRRGKNAIWIAAEITCGGDCVLTATFVFMGPVDSALHLDKFALPQDLIAPEEAIVFNPHRYMPVFLQNHFDIRFALPKSDEKRLELCWWVRLKDRSGIDPLVEVVLVGDALPPGVLPLMTPATVISSMTWQANLLTPAPVTRDGWWLLRSSADYAERGCSSQHMALWNADGEPIASGMQAIAIFG